MDFNNKEGRMRLRKALSVAYRQKEKARVSKGRQSECMAHIRRLGRIYPKPVFMEYFQSCVWRLVPAACTILLLLVLVITKLNIPSDDELVKMFTENPAEFTLTAFISE